MRGCRVPFHTEGKAGFAARDEGKQANLFSYKGVDGVYTTKVRRLRKRGPTSSSPVMKPAASEAVGSCREGSGVFTPGDEVASVKRPPVTPAERFIDGDSHRTGSTSTRTFVRTWNTCKSHGIKKIVISRPGKILDNISKSQKIWKSHGDLLYSLKMYINIYTF